MEHSSFALADKVKTIKLIGCFFVHFALVIYLDENKCVLISLLCFYIFSSSFCCACHYTKLDVKSHISKSGFQISSSEIAAQSVRQCCPKQTLDTASGCNWDEWAQPHTQQAGCDSQISYCSPAATCRAAES